MAALEQLDEDYKLNPITQPDARRRGDRAARRRARCASRWTSRSGPTSPCRLQGADGQAAGQDDRPRPTSTPSSTLFLERYAQIVPKLEGGAEIGDYVTADLTLPPRRQVAERGQGDPVPAPARAAVPGRHACPSSARPSSGSSPARRREAEAKIGSRSADPALRGQTIQVTFQVHDLKQLRLPEVNAAFLQLDRLRQPGGAARRAPRGPRAAARVRSSGRPIRREILDKLIAETPFDLPADLVARQEKIDHPPARHGAEAGRACTTTRSAPARPRSGPTPTRSTLRSLKEFFILAKIAEAEEIKVEDEDFEMEIEAIAARTDESARRVRARIEKEGLARRPGLADPRAQDPRPHPRVRQVSRTSRSTSQRRPSRPLDQTATAGRGRRNRSPRPSEACRRIRRPGRSCRGSRRRHRR